ncbi:MAG TPA: glycosyltransferase family 2 protein [Candidatus Korarchaeota archaeon]|nr:glycosyltransferase family 2 protein [Candidatus Korarchaeota archaeon]
MGGEALIGAVCAVTIFSSLISLVSAALSTLKPELAELPSELPLVSVIIPARDEEKNIGSCVESVLRQDYPRKEIIVVANGCRDHTAEIARSLGVEVLELEEASKPRALNIGASYAKGSLYLFLDADTVLPRGAIKSLLRYIYSADNIGAVVAAKDFVGEELHSLLARIEYSIIDVVSRVQGLFGTTFIYSGACSLVRREAFWAVGGFSNVYPSEDGDFGLKLMEAGFKVRYAPDVVVTQRLRYSFGRWVRYRYEISRSHFMRMAEHYKCLLRKNSVTILTLVLPSYLYSILMLGLLLYKLLSNLLTFELVGSLKYVMITLVLIMLSKTEIYSMLLGISAYMASYAAYLNVTNKTKLALLLPLYMVVYAPLVGLAESIGVLSACFYIARRRGKESPQLLHAQSPQQLLTRVRDVGRLLPF